MVGSVADKIRARQQAAKAEQPATTQPEAQSQGVAQRRVRRPAEQAAAAPVQRQAAPQGQAATGERKRSLLLGGDAVRRTMQTETTRKELQSKMRGMSRRFYLKKGTKANIVILDRDFEVGFFEHRVKIGQKFETVPCIKDHDNCPVCESGDKSSYVAGLTVLDLTPFESNGKQYEYSKKFMVVKGEQQGLFTRIWEKQGKNFRGLMLEMERGDGETSFSIGVPMVDSRLSEEDLKAEFLLDNPILKQDGSVLYPRDYFMKPFDYEKFIVFPTGNELRNLLGGSAAAGSDSYVDEEWNNGTRQAAGADIPYDGSEAGAQ